MRRITTATTPDEILAGYGPSWTRGLLSEHVDLFVRAGGTIRRAASTADRRWAVLPDGDAYPVVCSELVRIDTEDGPISGRCGRPARTSGYCHFHDPEGE